MLAFDPSHRVRHLVDVFEDMLGQPLRIAQRCNSGDVNVGKAARIGKTGAIDVGDSELGPKVLAKVERQSVHGIAEEPAVQVI